MHDLAAVIRQLRRLLRGDDGDETRGGHLARVGGEYPVDFFPDLELGGLQACGEQGGAEVGVAATDLAEEGAGDWAEETWWMGRREEEEGGRLV